MTSIFVTGGAGYIGSHVCKALKAAGFLPIAFDNLSTGHKDAVQWGPFFAGDLLKKEDILHAMKRFKPKAVMHFAASALVIESIKNPSKYYRNNVMGTLNLLDACVEKGISSFVFSSSCATYGIPKKTPITENTPQNPITPYGKSKLMIEQILKDYDEAHGIKSASLRYFNAAGASLDSEIGENHLCETHLIPLVIETAMGKRTAFTVYGDDFPTKDGFAIRDFIHVEDLASAHLKALDFLFAKKKSENINLGTGKGFSVFEVIKGLEKLKGKLPYHIAAKREGEPAELVADVSKAKKLLAWTPVYSDLETILSSAWRWHAKK